MIWLVTVFLILGIFLIAPFSASLGIEKQEKFQIKGRFSILWGGLLLQVKDGEPVLRVGHLVIGLKFISKNQEKAKNSEKRFWSESIFKQRQYFNREVIHSLLQLLGRLKRSLSIELKGECSLGFRDPAATGMFYGLIAASQLILDHDQLRIYPDFLRSGFNGYLTIEARAGTGKVLLVVGRFLWSSPIRKLWLSAIKERK